MISSADNRSVTSMVEASLSRPKLDKTDSTEGAVNIPPQVALDAMLRRHVQCMGLQRKETCPHLQHSMGLEKALRAGDNGHWVTILAKGGFTELSDIRAEPPTVT